MIRLKTINVDGNEVERTFESIAEILKNWWDEEETDLPGGDDEVLKLTVDGKSMRSLKHFAELIHELEILFWKGTANIKKMEERESTCNDSSREVQGDLENASQTVTEYCPHCNNEITMEWDVAENGYEAFCARCGQKLMLCSECLYQDDFCDWSGKKGFCYRQVEQLWKEFGQVAFTEDEEYRVVLVEDYPIALTIDFEDGRKSERKMLTCFPEGTNREEIWKWYDENHPKGVAYLLYGKDTRQKQTYEEWKKKAFKNILQAHGFTMEDELDESEEFYFATNQFFDSYKSVQVYYGSNTKELMAEKQIVKTEDGYVAVNVV